MALKLIAILPSHMRTTHGARVSMDIHAASVYPDYGFDAIGCFHARMTGSIGHFDVSRSTPGLADALAAHEDEERFP